MLLGDYNFFFRRRGDQSRISFTSISYKDFIPVTVVMGISRICRGNDAAHIAKRHGLRKVRTIES